VILLPDVVKLAAWSDAPAKIRSGESLLELRVLVPPQADFAYEAKKTLRLPPAITSTRTTFAALFFSPLRLEWITFQSLPEFSE